MPSIEDLTRQLAEARMAQEKVPAAAAQSEFGSPAVLSQPSEDPYAATAWAKSEYDFRVPSGQLCLLRKLPVEKLLELGILDQLTRLPGLTDKLITKSEGQPPAKEPDLDSQSVLTLVDVLDKLIPVVVVKPQIYPLPAEGQHKIPGRVYPDSIGLADRIAIMEEAMGGVKGFDNFRPES